MDESLRILILEDRATDADLAEYELAEAGIEFTSERVMTQNEFLKALEEFYPDLILSDYDLPQYNGALALTDAKKVCPDTPFILVTGAVGEDRAIEILTQGAKDYVLKNRLQQRLVPAVRRALAEAAEHKARKTAERELRNAYRTMEEQVRQRTSELQAEVDERKKAEERIEDEEARFQKLYQSNPHPIFIWQKHEEDFVLIELNLAARMVIKKDALDLIGKRAGEIYSKRKGVLQDLRQSFDGKEVIQREIPSRHFMPGKLLKTTYIFVPPDLVMVHTEDITDRKRVEEALQENAQYLRRVINAIFPFVAVLTPDGTLIEVNQAAIDAGGLMFEDCQGKKFWQCYWWSYSPELQRQLQENCKKAAFGEKLRYDVVVRMAGGCMMTIDFSLAPIFDDHGQIIHLVASAVDLTDRKRAGTTL
jgi:PAS domain S-box-containing protein